MTKRGQQSLSYLTHRLTVSKVSSSFSLENQICFSSPMQVPSWWYCHSLLYQSCWIFYSIIAPDGSQWVLCLDHPAAVASEKDLIRNLIWPLTSGISQIKFTGFSPVMGTLLFGATHLILRLPPPGSLSTGRIFFSFVSNVHTNLGLHLKTTTTFSSAQKPSNSPNLVLLQR